MTGAGNSADALADSALRMLGDKHYSQAEQQAKAALAIFPDHIAALGVLGFALHSLEKFDDAEVVFLRLAELQPLQALHWMNIGTARRCAKKLDEALYAFAKAAALGAATADFYYNVALAHIERNDYESARALLAKAHALAPDDAEIRYRYAWCCYECLQTDEALSVLTGWDSRQAGSEPVTAKIGQLLMKLGDTDRAEPVVRQAVINDTADLRSQLTLVQVLERTNRLAEATERLESLLANSKRAELGTELTLTHAQLAFRNGQHELACRLFQEVLDLTVELHDKHFVQYPYAKALDAAGRYDDAHALLVDAHLSQAAFLKLTVPARVLRGAPTMSIADFGCNAQDIAQWKDSNTPTTLESPVFVVAFPRSGTTLLELALDAHPLLESMDEQPFLQYALDEVRAEGIHYASGMAQINDEQLSRVRASYWRRVAKKVKLNPGQRLVDKNPLNLLRLPLIKRLFPNAHVLLAIRHPCDVLLSCFMQHFRAPDFALLCQDLPTLAGGYLKSFNFWYGQHALLRPKSLEIRYESFVDDYDAQIRAVSRFLELPWDDAMLTPGARAMEKRFISTPSYSQVVQPINKKAVGRWRRYEKHFAPVVPVLKPYLDRWGYDA